MKLIKGFKISNETRKKSIVVFILINIAILTVVSFLYYFPVNSNNFYPPCLWYKLTGTYCPGCGTVRGISFILNGNLLGLMHNNILAFLSLQFLVYTYIIIFVETIGTYHLSYFKFSRNEIIFFTLVIILYAVIRNLIDIFAPGLGKI